MTGSKDEPEPPIDALHARVDEAVRPLEALHTERLECKRGCSACCVDDLTVFEVEAERIRRAFPDVLATEPHPPGACAFLDAEGTCRVYAARPYVCRTQGLPLLFFSEDEDGDIAEERSICELNEAGPPLAELDQDAFWWIGPTEFELQQLQQATDGTQRRVALRDLFLAARDSKSDRSE